MDLVDGVKGICGGVDYGMQLWEKVAAVAIPYLINIVVSVRTPPHHHISCCCPSHFALVMPLP
jgi:hypothetical protein